MINKEFIQKAHDELCKLSSFPTFDNANKVLFIIHSQIMHLCPELSESECQYFTQRYEELLNSISFADVAFRKVYYSVISETCSKLKIIA